MFLPLAECPPRTGSTPTPADPELLARLDEGNRLLRGMADSLNQTAMRRNAAAKSSRRPKPLGPRAEQKTIDDLFAELPSFQGGFNAIAE